MDKRKLIFWGFIIIIAILIVFNLRINQLASDFKKDCTETYNINDSCPCQSIKQSNINYSNLTFNNITDIT